MKLSTKLVGLLAVAGLSLAACSSPAPTPSEEPAESGGASTEEDTTDANAGPFTIGVSNAFVGSEYRTQMIDAIQEVADEYKGQGLIDEVVMENADADVNGQIQQVRNLINRGVDVIIIDPNSATALDAVFKEAEAQGIKVYAIDQAVETESVLNIGISQQDLGEASAKWFAEKVGKGAKIVTVEGSAGNPATEARWAGAEPVFEEYGIEVLTRGDGGWDQTTGQTVATDLLATYPDIQGIWTYDGMAQGTLKALEAAGKTDSVVTMGEARGGFMRMWNDLLSTGFETAGVVNPPGTGATALHFAVNELQGKTLDSSKVTDGHNIVLPLAPLVTNENFVEIWEPISDVEDGYVVDSIMTADEVAAYFK
ncbi:substrate-binding domain-containing protein [Actinomycetaceae bacterium MB13-C1-2]|nr:substrate-binding domain-containing protein [Actinomycetaceae bacterium MB13-C1-2]